MSIRSLFSRKDKKGSSTSPQLPNLPSVREMLEDMENIKKNDPILSLAAIIEKKGKHSVVDSDIKELMEALRKRRKSEEQSASSTLPSFRRPSLIKAPSFGKDSHEPAASPIGIGSSGSGSGGKAKANEGKKALSSATTAVEQTLNYDKLKHFLTTCEHSQELISTLEPEFKKFENEIAEYSKSFDPDEKESLSEDSGSESRLT